MPYPKQVSICKIFSSSHCISIACKAIVDHVLAGDVTRVARYQARFAGVVFPGETIVTSVWEDGDKLLIQASTKERSTPVITNSAIWLR